MKRKPWEDRWCDRILVVNPYYFGLVTSEAAYYEECDRLEIPKADQGVWISNDWSNATVSHFEKPGHKPILIVAIRVDETRTGIQIAGLLVHEAVHIWQKICRHLGEDNPSSEFEAYSIQWIAQELMESYTAQVKVLKG